MDAPRLSLVILFVLFACLLSVHGDASAETEEAMEEIRSAISNQWDALQHIRYQALLSRMTAGRIGARIKHLVASQTPSEPQPQPETEPCDEEEEGNKIGTLADATEELLQVYARYVNSTNRGPAEEGPFLEDLQRMKDVVDKLKALADEGRGVETTTTSEGSTTPEVQTEHRRVFAQLGGYHYLQCPVNSKEYTVSWLQDETVLTKDGIDEIFEDHIIAQTNDLLILRVRKSDKGFYDCKATHRSSGRVYNIITYELDVNECTISVPPQATVGTNQTLSCSYDLGNDTVDSIQWFYGDGYFSNYVFFHYKSFENPQLSTFDKESLDVIREASVPDRIVLREVGFSSEGIYRCVVRPTHLRTALKCSAKMTVVDSSDADPVPVGKAEVLIESLGDVTSTGGHAVTLSCRVTADEEVTVSWKRKRDGLLLSTASFSHTDRIPHSVAHDEASNVWHLTLAAVRTKDEAFECRAIGLSGESVDTVRVTLGYENVTALLRSKATLSCKPPEVSKVRWVRGDRDTTVLTVGGLTFAPDDRYSSIYDPTTRSWVLTIADVTEADAGPYECQVQQLDVGPSASSLRWDRWTMYMLSVAEPSISDEFPNEVTVDEGSTAVLNCRVLNLGSNTVSWVYNGDLYLTGGPYSFTSDDRFSVSNEDSDLWQLRIRDAKPQDSGSYDCQVTARTRIVNTIQLTVVATTTTTTTTTTTATTTTPKRTPRRCRPPFQLIGTNLCVYIGLENKLSWFDARDYCRTRGGDLAKGDDSYIRTYLEQQFGISGETWTRWPFWLGGTKEEEEEVWRWTDGEEVDASIWAEEEPRSYSRRSRTKGTCLVLDGFRGYAAAALPCHARRRFVCRRY